MKLREFFNVNEVNFEDEDDFGDTSAIGFADVDSSLEISNEQEHEVVNRAINQNVQNGDAADRMQRAVESSMDDFPFSVGFSESDMAELADAVRSLPKSNPKMKAAVDSILAKLS